MIKNELIVCIQCIKIFKLYINFFSLRWLHYFSFFPQKLEISRIKKPEYKCLKYLLSPIRRIPFVEIYM